VIVFSMSYLLEQELEREPCLLKNQNLILATSLFVKEIEEDFSRFKLLICKTCKSKYGRKTRLQLHKQLLNVHKSLLKMRDLMAKR